MKTLTLLIFLSFFLYACLAMGEGRSPVRISIKSRADVTKFVKLGINIDDVRDTYIEAYCSEVEFGTIEAMGYRIVWIPNYAKICADSLWEATKNTENPMAEYHTYEELTLELQQIADSNPDICHLETIGQSVWERELWFMKISDNVDIEEDEPEFKYISTMHGNEPVGMELLLYLIRYLVDNYGTDPQVTFLIDETEIWIMPLMNPDGYDSLHSRCNAHGVDLNRNFPDRITDSVNTPEGREPETQAVMNWAFNHSSVLSANFHTGALVVNYPYDSNESGASDVYTPTPDDSLFIYISEAYSTWNDPMWNGSFHNGITNGTAWYLIWGGMQDWNYVWLGCNEVTIELWDGFGWPSVETLSILWEDNRDAMLAYMEMCHIGVRGIVTDSLTGEPLNAIVDVLEIGHPVYTDPDIGDYHRMLLAGDYTLKFSSPGYVTKTIPDIHVGTDSVTILDVKLYKPLGVEETHGFQVSGFRFQHLKAYPNPFREKTVIEFRGLGVASGFIPDKCGGQAPTLQIYDLSGRIVRSFKLSFAEGNFSTLNSHLPKATLALSTVMWDGTDDFGTKLPSGVYIVKAQVPSLKSQVTSKVILIR